MKNSKNAPRASENSPEPINSTHVTSGGSNATAAITPIKVVLKHTVKANAPAIPEANARVILPRLILALKTISGLLDQL